MTSIVFPPALIFVATSAATTINAGAKLDIIDSELERRNEQERGRFRDFIAGGALSAVSHGIGNGVEHIFSDTVEHLSQHTLDHGSRMMAQGVGELVGQDTDLIGDQVAERVFRRICNQCYKGNGGDEDDNHQNEGKKYGNGGGGDGDGDGGGRRSGDESDGDRKRPAQDFRVTRLNSKYRLSREMPIPEREKSIWESSIMPQLKGILEAKALRYQFSIFGLEKTLAILKSRGSATKVCGKFLANNDYFEGHMSKEYMEERSLEAMEFSGTYKKGRPLIQDKAWYGAKISTA
ncbi:hypothetical protein N431DRAFT_468956 [Stipitochalara longipes BDJ]|nr:hypothetical protein N431DRAFT_468956 [Stipitochalara longipes BDJ]